MKFILGFATVLFSVQVLASLQVYPTRIVLSPGQKSAQVSLRYKGNGEETYRVSTKFYEMKSDGSMKVKKNPGKADLSAHKLIRFSPKKVKLKKDVEQVVRILLRRTDKLKEGEYRTHIYFKPSDKVQPGAKGTSVAFNLQAKIAVAVPVIVKVGKPQVKVKLSKLKLMNIDGKMHFRATLEKSGSGFAFGDLRLHKIVKGKKQIVGRVNGVSSYIKKRTVTYPLDEDSKIPVKKGDKLELTFLDGESKKVVAETKN